MNAINNIINKFDGISAPCRNDLYESLGIYTKIVVLRSDEDYEIVKDYADIAENDVEFNKPLSYPKTILVVDETSCADNTFIYDDEDEISNIIKQFEDCADLMKVMKR